MAPTRQLVSVSLHDYAERKQEITAQLMHAAENVGFFYVHEPHVVALAQKMFAVASNFFELKDEVKAKRSFRPQVNKGWEKMAQIRPSTGTPDMKESISLGWNDMEHCERGQKISLWPTEEECPGFKAAATEFMGACEDLSGKLLSCFALGLGFPEDYFRKVHDITKPDCQQTLRCLCYHDITGQSFPPDYWRAGAHTDFDVLTLIVQRPGEGGLEVCPGREVVTEFAMGNVWTPVEPTQDAVVVNIGDMLMQWSDDRLKSTFHRVRTPRVGEYQGRRLSLAYFNQANRSAVIQGPLKKYPAITGEEFLKAAMKRNYDALAQRRRAEEAQAAAGS